ncbi:MAG: hypothetical protein ABIP03_00470 [Aquihabitans sp.]
MSSGPRAQLIGLSRRLPNRVWVPAVVGFVVALVFVGALLLRAGGDASLLVHAGPPWTDAAQTRDSLTVQPADGAFDGQFFYRLGVAPWSTQPEVAGVTYDLPALRNARWGYGALAWLGSGGNPDLVPWTLLGLNLIAVTAIGAIGGALAGSAGRHRAWGALFVFWPGFAYSLSLDTSELVASAFVLGGLLALRHRYWLPSAVLLTAAVLTRDTTAVIPFAVAVSGAHAWMTNRPIQLSPLHNDVAVVPTKPLSPNELQVAATRQRSLFATAAANVRLRQITEARDTTEVGLIALVAFGGWQLITRSRFHALPLTSSGDNNLSAPFGGLVDQVLKVVPPSGSAEALRLICIVGLVALLGTAGWTWRRSTASTPERMAWLPAVVVVAVLNAYLWSGATAFMRATTEAGLLSIVVILSSTRTRLLAFVGIGLASLWTLTAIAQLTKLG